MTDNEHNESGEEDVDESRPTVTVPKYGRGDEVVAWMEVDEEWWEHSQRARDVNDRVVELVSGNPGVNYIEKSRGDDMIAGLSTSCITIGVDDTDTADALQIPDEINGIPIAVKVDRIRDMPE